jgi:hypothetical protein
MEPPAIAPTINPQERSTSAVERRIGEKIANMIVPPCSEFLRLE